MHQNKDQDLDTLEFLINIKNVHIMQSKGKGGFRDGHESKWWRLLCTIKKIVVSSDKSLNIEESILVSISHFNLIKYYFIIEHNIDGKKKNYLE